MSFSERTEFWLIVLVAFGFSIWNSVRFAFVHQHSGVLYSDWNRLWSCGIQLAVFAFVVWLGRIRGWSIRDFGFHPSWRQTGMGFLLFFATNILFIPLALAAHMLLPSSYHRSHDVAAGLSMAGILVTAIINPPFEEILGCGYIIQRLAKRVRGQIWRP